MSDVEKQLSPDCVATRTSSDLERTHADSIDTISATKWRFSLRGILIGFTFVVLILAVLTTTFRRAAHLGAANHIRNSFRSTFLAIANFDSATRRLPPASYCDELGNELSSWRFQVLPYWGVNDLGRQYYRSKWDAPINQRLLTWDAIPYALDRRSENFSTSVFAVAGRDTAFEDPGSTNRSSRSLKDLPYSLIVIMETSNSGVHWMEPGDYQVDDLLAATGRLGDTVKGTLYDQVHVMFADGEVWALSPNTPMASLHLFLTITSAKNADRDESLSPFRVDRQ